MAIEQEKSNKRRIYIISASAILLLILGFFLYRYRQGQLQKQKDLEIRTKQAEIEMKLLRLQLNPHFIFNSLNSIADYIQKNNIKDADEYLVKFAKLMRGTLESSEEKEIPLSEELEMIELYIQLEAKRLGNKVNYHLTVQDGVDTTTLLVPPLILQPLVENSIWHGLAGKEEGGNISIDIRLQNDMLVIHVDDNGVGIKHSQIIKKNKKSFGFGLTKDRIEILNNLKKANATIDIHDLPIGTRVALQLPLMRA